jgi:hypothetical protein
LEVGLLFHSCHLNLLHLVIDLDGRHPGSANGVLQCLPQRCFCAL